MRRPVAQGEAEQLDFVCLRFGTVGGAIDGPVGRCVVLLFVRLFVRSIVPFVRLFVRSIDCSFVDCSLCCVVLCGVVLRCVVLLFRLVRSFFRSFVRSSFHRFVVRTVGASVRRSVCYFTWDGFRFVTLATWLHRFVRCIGSLVLGQQFGALVRWRCCLPLFGCWDQATTRWVTESKTEAAVGTTFRCVMFRKLAGL